ncbi:MAG: hypothetical protein KatS3mg100_120 [Candidatus Parcubacteria bacterium]|nr:MAG: hypothetical protein KatS3mg100_120 [Candidatus Parcubacteria bacterium]
MTQIVISSTQFAPVRRVWSETRRSKVLGRVLLAETLAHALRRHPRLQDAKVVVELGYAPASHQKVYPSAWQVAGANIKPGPGVRYVFDINAPSWPLEERCADIIIAMHTLYLARDPCAVLRRAMSAARVAVIWNGPFISSYAPHPVDYHRFSYDWLRDTLPPEWTWYLYPYGGRASAAYTLLEGGLPKILRLCAAPVVLGLDRWEARRNPKSVPRAPLGFLVVGLPPSV